MNCEVFRTRLDSYIQESMDEDERRGFRRHLRDCGQCRKWALASDPCLTFAVEDPIAADSVRIEQCVGAVTAQIRQERLNHRLRGRRRPWLAAAAAMAMVVSLGLVWTSMFGDDEQLPVSLAEAPATELDIAAPTVEVDMPEEDVRVYQFANEEDRDTAVYFIVNPALEL